MRNNHSPELVERSPVIRMLQAADLCYARIFHRLEVTSPCRLPRRGPAILVCNHINGLDPVLIQSVCPRLIVWIMAREYYEQPVLRWVFEQVMAIPIDRGRRDMSAMRSAMRTLANGHVLGVFPEGRIETTRALLPFQTGPATMAIKTGVPVYPAHIEGTQRGRPMLKAYLKPQRASVSFGPRIDLNRFCDSRNDVETATNVLQKAVRDLMTAI